MSLILGPLASRYDEWNLLLRLLPCCILISTLIHIDLGRNIVFIFKATVREWLLALALPQYIPWFVAQGLSNTDQIMQLTFEDFEDIGVKKLGHLKKLICALKKLKDNQQNNCRSSTPINYVSSNGISEVLLINVPTTPKHIGEIRPYYHSPQSQHNYQTLSSSTTTPSSSASNSMRTFHHQQNKYQVWFESI